MPPPLLRAYIRKLGELEASESLLWLNRLAIGTGSVKEADSFTATRIRDEWSRRAQGIDLIDRPKTPDERASLARASGIGVKRVPKEKP